MSELTKTALANMQAKRIKRIEDAAKRSQIPDIATYQGKSTIDGTDIVQVGANEPTSGFRLTSNASVTTGEKVSLRPSAIGGLQRVDARNRPIEQNTDIARIDLELSQAILINIGNEAILVTRSWILEEIVNKKIGFNEKISSSEFKYQDQTINEIACFRVGGLLKFEYDQSVPEFGVVAIIINCQCKANSPEIKSLNSKGLKCSAKAKDIDRISQKFLWEPDLINPKKVNCFISLPVTVAEYSGVTNLTKQTELIFDISLT